MNKYILLSEGHRCLILRRLNTYRRFYAPLINFRHNPVGKVFSKEELQAIGDLCVKHNILILSDEVCSNLPKY